MGGSPELFSAHLPHSSNCLYSPATLPPVLPQAQQSSTGAQPCPRGSSGTWRLICYLAPSWEPPSPQSEEVCPEPSLKAQARCETLCEWEHQGGGLCQGVVMENPEGEKPPVSGKRKPFTADPVFPRTTCWSRMESHSSEVKLALGVQWPSLHYGHLVQRDVWVLPRLPPQTASSSSPRTC